MEYHGVVRAELELKLYKNSIRVKKRDFVAPSAALLAVLLTLLTAKFHDALTISASTWQAIFIVVAVLCAARLVQLGISHLCDPPMTVEELVDECLEVRTHQR